MEQSESNNYNNQEHHDSGSQLQLQQQQQQQQQQQHQQPQLLQHQYTSQAHSQVYFQQQMFDVRMKRHPELQPYVPSDRYSSQLNTGPAGKGLFGGSSSLSSKMTSNHHVVNRAAAVASSSAPTPAYKTNNSGTRSYRTGGPTTMTTATSNNTNYNNNRTNNVLTKSNSKQQQQPKKYVSMTRLDQLAQPKKNTLHQQRNSAHTNVSTVPPSSLTSSNATSTTASSLSSNKNYNHTSISTMKTRRSVAANSTSVNTSASNNNHPQPNQQQRRLSNGGGHSGVVSRLSIDANKSKQEVSSSTPATSSATASKSIKTQNKRDSLVPQQPSPSDHSPRESTPIKTAADSAKVNDSNGDFISPIKQVVGNINETIHHQPTTPPSVAATRTINNTTINKSSHINESQSNGEKEGEAEQEEEEYGQDEASFADLMSEVSINDRTYQSAASELLQDSEKSMNGVNIYDRNADSLCRELERDLIAKGIVKDDSEIKPLFAESDNSVTRASTATLMSASGDFPKVSKEEELRRLRSEEEQRRRSMAAEEEEKRLRIEEELREQARHEDLEREKRQSIVDGILSKFNQNS